MTKLGSKLLKPITTIPTNPTDIVSKSYSDGYVTNNAITTVNDILTNKINIDSSLDYSIVGTTAIIKSVRKEVLFKPSGTSDDFARLQILADSLIGAGGTIILAPGTFHATTMCEVKDGWPNITCTPNAVRIIANQTKTPSQPIPALFHHSFPTVTSYTSLSAIAVRGAKTIQTSSISSPVISQGMAIEIAASLNEFQTQYRVSGPITGSSGAYIIPLDRPLEVSFPNGAAVYPTPALNHWKFTGNGCTISGVISRYFSIMRGWRCVVSGIVFDDIDGVASDLLSFDIAGVGNIIEDIEYKSINGTYPDTGGLIFESNVSSIMRNLRMGDVGKSVGFGGLTLETCIDCKIEHASAHSALISCDQGIISSGCGIGVKSIFQKIQLGQSRTDKKIENVLIEDVTIISPRDASDPTDMLTFINTPASGVVLKNIRWKMPTIQSNAIRVKCSVDFTGYDLDVSAGYTSYTGLSEANVNKFILQKDTDPAVTFKATIYNSKINDCEVVKAMNTSSNVTLNLIDVTNDASLVASASQGSFYYDCATCKINLLRFNGISSNGGYAALQQAPTVATVTVQDSIFSGGDAWRVLSGTLTGYKRGQTTLSTTAGTWTTTSW